ncbi:hypothetical protein [Runella slithyformis]|uniref:Uncharacterized protein n=1 Tax=Runella slithyformis (strain ATCC 29530 / DSM 19594 / LMG 11500 / NCIMB 11436 / LSU 4) TaxID=761193 RepID=A0A7U3ZN34_RUNSL|nr:hypothetical protein [Runella slithyformis]AEI50255.1 hypothetical protein Runsl_3899 [Runella slithyformis DSM 19594]
MKSYQIETGVNQETGEIIFEDKYLYFEGRPREYRYNGQNGQFNRYGTEILTDKSNKILQSFTFQPIAFRIFDDCLFGRAGSEAWAEIFFIDSENTVSGIMFNNTSVQELMRLLEPLMYSRKKLTDVILTARPEKVSSKSDPSKTWYIARFTYEFAEPETIQEYQEYTADRRIFRAETITPNQFLRLYSPNLEPKKIQIQEPENA